MPAGMSVDQMGHPFHWLQMQSHLNIHSGLIPIYYQQNQLYQSNPVDFMFCFQ